jgi:crotonobetainyl-CoA:carnitine CoA-transferase CaiB-like acyl-CoA transferase
VPTESVQSAAEVLATPHLLERGAFRYLEIEPGIIGPVPQEFLEIDGERVGIRHLATTVSLDEIEALWKESSQEVVSVRDRHFGEGPLSGSRVLDLGASSSERRPLDHSRTSGRT